MRLNKPAIYFFPFSLTNHQYTCSHKQQNHINVSSNKNKTENLEITLQRTSSSGIEGNAVRSAAQNATMTEQSGHDIDPATLQ